MAIALTLEVRDYVLESDRELPETEQTVFKIRPLTALEQAKLEDTRRYGPDSQKFKAKIKEEEVELALPSNLTSMATNRVLYSLEGWTNFKDENGGQIAFDNKHREANLNRLFRAYIFELSNAIEEMSQLKGEEEKN